MMLSPAPSAQSIQFPTVHHKPPEDRRESLSSSEYRYIGEYNASNQRHGFGRAFFKTGDSYEGYYENGKRHGHGMYRFMNGAVYDGQWVNGMKNGLGVFTYPDGSKYEGNWLDDQRSEHGVYTYVNGDKYDGHWRYHVRHGSGRYIYAHAGLQYQGTWNDGKREGIGHLLDYGAKETTLQSTHPSTDSVKSDEETVEQHEKHVQEQRRQTDHFLELDKRYGHEKKWPYVEGSASDIGSTQTGPTEDGPREDGPTADGPTEDGPTAEIPRDVLVPGGEAATEGEGRAAWWDAQKPSQPEEGQATWVEEQVHRQQEDVLVPGGEAVTEAEGRVAWWEAQGQRQQEGMESQHDAQSQHDTQSQHEAQGQPNTEGHQNVEGLSAEDHEHRGEGHEDGGEKDGNVTESHDHQSHSQQNLTEGNKDQNEGQQNEGNVGQNEGQQNEGNVNQNEGQQNEGNKDQTDGHQHEGDNHQCQVMHLEGQQPNCDANGCAIKRTCTFPLKDESSFYDLLSSSFTGGVGGPNKDPAEAVTTDQSEEQPKDIPDATQLGIELIPPQVPRNDSNNSDQDK